MKRFISLWLPVILWASIIFYLSSLPNLRITDNTWDFLLRKLAHMGFFGMLALLLRRAFKGSTQWSARRLFLTSLTMTFLYACSDEYHQHFVQGRHADVVDVLIDSAGAVIALAVL